MTQFSYGYTQNQECPSPEVFIRVFNPSNFSKSITIPGIVDSGAVMTCIPESKLKNLGQLTYSSLYVRDFNNNVCEKKTYFVDILLDSYPEPFPIEVIATPKLYALIGRDILNQKKVMLHAEKDIWIYDCIVDCPLDTNGD